MSAEISMYQVENYLDTSAGAVAFAEPSVARTWPDVFGQLVNPITGEVDPDWYSLRFRYRRPLGYFFSMHSTSGRILKRTTDCFLSLLALIALMPVFLITAVAIRLDSPGPIFFLQPRVGRGGTHFQMYKFRSMVIDAERLKVELLEKNESRHGVIFKIKDDPRITRVGRFIRKYSIDELPQLINVLKGEMSLVGPRPPVPGEVLQYEDDTWKRLTVVPGLTCTWQISGRSNIGFRDQVELDVRYIIEQGLWLDILFMFRTIPAILRGEGAY